MTLPLRPIRPEDFDAVYQLKRRIEEHDRIPAATARGELQEWVDEPHFNLETDSRLVESNGDVVAWGRIWYSPSGERQERAYAFGGVDPAHRQRGIGSALFAWEIMRAGELMSAAPSDLPRYVRTQVYDFQKSSLKLFSGHGLEPVRYTDEMLCELDTIPPYEPVSGIEIVSWARARSEEARVAQNEAFADHWGTTPRDPAAWENLIRSFGNRHDLSFMALDGNRIVGQCRNGNFPEDDMVTGRRDGWILDLSVIRSHRKRGIASALITRSLAAFKASGMTNAVLGVDSENQTGAYHLYERLGFRRLHRLVVSEMAMSPKIAAHKS